MEVSIVVPVHNEERTIGSQLLSLVEMMDREKLDGEIVMVNDNSTDCSGRIAKEIASRYSRVRVIHRHSDPGFGKALKVGTEQARGKFVIWTMGDQSDDVGTIPRMIHILNNGYDLVFGSRYMKGGSRGDAEFIKAMLSSGFTRIARILFGINAHDITNAFRGFKKEIYENIKLEYTDFSISPELSIKAHLKGYRLGQVPTTYMNRKVGESKFNIPKMVFSFSRVYKYKFIRPK